MIYVGKAGWSLRKEYQPRFPDEGTHLQRYAQVLPAVEINSSFRNWHRASTYERWGQSVPEGFRFSVKVHEDVTHKGDLENWKPMERFLKDTAHLGRKLAVYLVQLPPSHTFQNARARAFFERMKGATDAEIVCEPRHATWFQGEAGKLFRDLEVGRVAADPPPVESGRDPGGWQGVVYLRWHGSPEMYYDSYSEDELDDLADRLQSLDGGRPVWCIFDNTARGAGTLNALDLWDRIRP